MTHGHSEVSHRFRGGMRKGKNAVAREILKGIKEQLERENREILAEVASEIRKTRRSEKEGS